MRVEANAKINLALHVVGQRDDGYHLLDTLVAFANVADILEFTPAEKTNLSISGPQSSDLEPDKDNLVLKAATLLKTHVGRDDLHANIRLEKNLPIASGIGGGSADAAATLKALNELWQLELSPSALAELALKLGADVPMCLHGQSLRARGIGEDIAPLAMPSMPLVLVNPKIAVSTPEIFRLLATKENPPLPPFDDHSTTAELMAWLEQAVNDLEKPAIEMVPEIATCIEALTDAGARIARMSGSGATCFGLFETSSAAERAQTVIAKQHPNWWVDSGHTL